MNYKSLSTISMLGLSGGWIEDPLFVAELRQHSLGVAVCEHMAEAHGQLASLYGRRCRLLREIEDMGTRLGVLGERHNSKARSLHNLLEALAEGCEDAVLRGRYLVLKTRLFPYGLSIVRLSYMEAGGAMRMVMEGVTSEVMEELAGIRVGEQTLADLYNDWSAAGTELGRLVHERQERLASIKRDGTEARAINGARMRFQWIRAARLMAEALDMLSISPRMRQRFYAPLEASVASASRRGKGQPSDDSAGPDSGEAPDDAAGPNDGTVVDSSAGSQQATAPDGRAESQQATQPNASAGSSIATGPSVAAKPDDSAQSRQPAGASAAAGPDESVGSRQPAGPSAATSPEVSSVPGGSAESRQMDVPDGSAVPGDASGESRDAPAPGSGSSGSAGAKEPPNRFSGPFM